MCSKRLLPGGSHVLRRARHPRQAASPICVLNETGQVAHRAQVRGIDEMLRILEGLPDRFEVCYEASCGYGHYHDLLRPLAARVAGGASGPDCG